MTGTSLLEKVAKKGIGFSVTIEIALYEIPVFLSQVFLYNTDVSESC